MQFICFFVLYVPKLAKKSSELSNLTGIFFTGVLTEDAANIFAEVGADLGALPLEEGVEGTLLVGMLVVPE
jgi:hypothetical protein